jgi:hypothetical protein
MGIPKRLLRCWPIAVVSCIAASTAVSTASGSEHRVPCASPGYAYAGASGTAVSYGVAGQITELVGPSVASGHVAAWIGLGGVHSGPGGTAAWIQAGYSAFPGQAASNLYYEVAQPGNAPRYRLLNGAQGAQVSHRIAVRELTERPGWWRIWLDRRPVSPPVHLPGSHGRWLPLATGESWAGDQPACNRYAFRFDRLATITRPGSGWAPLTRLSRFQDPGYQADQPARATLLARSEATAPTAHAERTGKP